MQTLPQVDQILRRAAEAGEVPGLVAMAATADGPLYAGAFGRREIGKGAAMTADTVFWIASMTKAVTSVAAMQLVEQGRLTLDGPLGELLPALAAPQVLEGFDAAGAPRLRPAKRPVTLRHLLTHTAGFSYDMWNAAIGRYMQHAGIPGIITCRNDALRTPLVADPGERWEYGVNVDWAGKAVEAASGQSLDAYLRAHVLEPLGMHDTGFVLSPEQRGRLAAMHQRQPDGSLQPVPFEVPQAPEFFMGGGGLYGTGPDYLNFLRMLLNGGRLDRTQILRPETVAAMAQNQIGALTAGVMRTAMPHLTNDVDFFPGMDLKWGLGFLINPQPGPAGRSAGSLTWAGLANTYFWVDPARRVAGLILTQILPFADARALALYGAFERGVYEGLKAAA